MKTLLYIAAFMCAAVHLDAGSVSGTLVDHGGTVLANYKLEMYIGTAVYKTTSGPDGSFTFSDVTSVESGALPADYAVSSNYPNPFNPRTRIALTLPAAAGVRLEVYNVLGKRVLPQREWRAGAGLQHVDIELHGEPNGIYIARVTIDGKYSVTRKLLLLYGSRHLADATADVVITPRLGANDASVPERTISSDLTTVDSMLAVSPGSVRIVFYQIPPIVRGVLNLGNWQVATSIPSKPALASPIDASQGNALSPTLQWLSTPGASTYQVQVSTGSGFATTIFNKIDIKAATSQTVGPLSPVSTFYWRVRASNGYGTSDWSTPFSFTTGTLVPLPPVLASPADGAVNQGTTPTLVWNASTEAKSYTLQVATDAGFTSPVFNQSGLTAVNQQLTGLSASGSYYWRVSATNTKGTSGWSAVWGFSTGSSSFVHSMVSVAAGSFKTGATTVSIGAFSIDKYEITYDLWTEVRAWGSTHGYTDLPAGANGVLPAGANNPVGTISWYDAVKWCNARSEKNNVVPAYYTDTAKTTIYKTGEADISNDMVKWTGSGYRLPTEAEWEYAARGGSQSQGYTYSGGNTVGNVAWYEPNSTYSTHPVGTKSANELGIHDMSGNVLEYCWDWYGKSFPAGGTVDPKGPAAPMPSQKNRMLRGGSFNSSAEMCTAVSRAIYDWPNSRLSSGGVRTVRK